MTRKYSTENAGPVSVVENAGPENAGAEHQDQKMEDQRSEVDYLI